MSDICAQFGVLAQGPDLEGWTDLLVILIMAALWLVGGVIKAISNRRSARQGKQEGPARPPRRPPGESWQERLARRAQEMQRAIEQGQRPRSTPAPVVRPPQPPGGKISIRQGPRGESVMVYERAEPQAVPATAQREHQAARQRQAEEAVAAAGRAAAKEPSPLESKVETKSAGPQPRARGLPDITLEPPELSELDRQETEVSRDSRIPESATLLDWSDPHALRRTILLCEIFGTPVALREPFE